MHRTCVIMIFWLFMIFTTFVLFCSFRLARARPLPINFRILYLTVMYLTKLVKSKQKIKYATMVKTFIEFPFSVGTPCLIVDKISTSTENKIFDAGYEGYTGSVSFSIFAAKALISRLITHKKFLFLLCHPKSEW